MHKNKLVFIDYNENQKKNQIRKIKKSDIPDSSRTGGIWRTEPMS